MRLAVLLVVSAAAAARAEQPLAEYPKAPATRIGNDVVIGGEYYRLGYFTTDDAIDTVLKYFNHEWEEAGYPVTIDGDVRTQAVISAFYTRQGLVRSIVLTHHEGKTLGFTVLKDLWAKAPKSKPDQLPALEGALFANDMVTRSDAGGSQHRTAAVPLPLEAAVAARKKAWLELGWALSRELRVAKEQRVLEFARGEQVAQVTLVEVDAKTTAMDETWVGAKK